MPEVLGYPFVQRALVAVLLSSLVLGGLSPLVVARRLAFFSAALGQAVLTGVALGVLLGEPLDAPWGSVFGFSLLVGVGLVAARRRSELPTDTLVGVALAFTLGLGVCLLVAVTKRFNVHQLEAVMFGSVLTVSPWDLVALGVLGLVVLGVTASFANRLLLQATDARLAAAARVPDARDEYLFVALLTVAIVVSVKVMGALMVEAMLVVPAAAARNGARSVAGVFAGSVVVALVAGLGGLAVSTQLNVPSGAAIVLGLSLLFLLSLIARRAPRASRRRS
jgi:zinc transport system permease protein